MSGSNSSTRKGFALVLELTIALAIFIAFLAFFLNAPKTPSALAETVPLQKGAQAALNTLDENGILLSILDDNALSDAQRSLELYTLFQNQLPQGWNARLDIRQFDANTDICESEVYTDCFVETGSFVAQGGALPANRETIRTRRIISKKQPPIACIFSAGTSSLAPQGTARIQHPALFSPLSIDGQMPADFERQMIRALNAAAETNAIHAPIRALLQSGNTEDINIVFSSSVTPSGSLDCDANLRVDLNAVMIGGRTPMDVMVVIDRSGSMTWTGNLGTTDPTDVFVDGNWTYLADGSAGLRDINTQNPWLPASVGTYNSPGSGVGVWKSGNYAYLADAQDGLQIVNVSNPTAPSLSTTFSGIANARAVEKNGNYAFVVSQDYTGTNDTLTIGRNSSNTSAAQTFVARKNTFNYVDVYVRKQGNPANDLIVRLRSSISGADIATATISRNAISTSYNWHTASFSPQNLTVGNTYYIVLTTAANNNSNYFQWASNDYSGSANLYLEGQAYVNTTAQANVDTLFRTHGINTPGLYAINVTNPLSPTLGDYNTFGTPTNVSTNGNYVYVTDDAATNRLRIFDATTPTNLVALGIGTTTDAQDVAVTGGFAYVANGTNGLRVFDVSNPNAPALVTTVATPGTAYEIKTFGTYAYLADDTALLEFDLSTPWAPVQTRSFPTQYGYRSLWIDNNIAYMGATGSNYFITIDLNTGPRIDAAKTAATRFIDSNLWQAPPDQIGLASFSNPSASLDHNLTSDRNAVIASVAGLVGGGGTNIQIGLQTALGELTGRMYNADTITYRDTNLRIGYNAGETTAAQSFQVGSNRIDGALVHIQRVGNPGNLTLNLRSSINGANLASVTINAAQIPSGGFGVVRSNFSSGANVTSGNTYYLVLSTSTLSTTDYYAWGRRANSAGYSSGTAYQNSSSTSGDLMMRSYYNVSSNRNPDALPFIVLMTDGQSSNGDSNMAARQSKDENAIVFTVGFGADVSYDELGAIAKTADGNCYLTFAVPSPGNCINPINTGSSFNGATALAALYQIIGEQIGEIQAQVSTTRVNDSNFLIYLPLDANVVDANGGTVMNINGQNAIYYHSGVISIDTPWYGAFTMKYACDNTSACGISQFKVPDANSAFWYVNTSDEPQDPLPFDSNHTLTLRHRDLTLQILDARVISGGRTVIDVNIINAAEMGSASTLLEYRLDNPVIGTLVKTSTVSAFACGALEPACMNYTDTQLNQVVNTQGHLYLILNRSQNPADCPNNNVAEIDCQSGDSSRLYVIDAWIWR